MIALVRPSELRLSHEQCIEALSFIALENLVHLDRFNRQTSTQIWPRMQPKMLMSNIAEYGGFCI